MKAAKRALLLLLCVAMLVAGVIVMSACTGKCVHTWGDWKVTTAATCIAEGTETRTCDACGETETRGIDKIAHTFSTYVADGNATCQADGTKTATCTTPGCTAKDTVADTGSKTNHVFTNYTSNDDATCQKDGTKTATCNIEGCNATATVTDEGSKKDHSFTTYHSDNNATCMIDGTKTAICDYYGCNATDCVTDAGSKKDHSFKNYVSNGDATCVLDGTKTATCIYIGCDETDTIEDEGSKLGHLWNAELTCESGHYCTRGGCDAEEAALGHDYAVVGGTALTCEQDSTTVYACRNGCGDSFTVTNEVARGHSVETWKFDSEESIGECTYILTYTGICQNDNCGQTVTKTEQAVRHTLKSTIDKDATCSTPGKKHITCSDCDYEAYESYTNKDAHVWVVKSTVGNVTTYECYECSATKTAITATEQTEATVDKSTLESVGEVELKDASIALDNETLGGLEGNVQISAGTLEGKDLDAVMGQLGDKINQIGDHPIYNFGLNDANGTVSNFDGWVTIRVPYVLTEGDDVDSIAVWFINANGEVESIEAVYDNGYAVFSTNHFSYYTVTRLSPIERCNLYGHSYKETVVNASCISDGYVLKVCQRCGDSTKEITEKATGHSIITTVVPATCTESGTATHTCENCSYERIEKIAPLGHTWEATENVDATCQSAGYTIYTCSTCQATYKTVLAQKAHSYTSTVTKPTCTTDGYTTKVCEWCQYTVITNKIDALGHDYKASTVAATCTTDGYTLHDCSRCDASYKTDIIPAAHTWDIEAPTCGKGQICIVCGQNGQAATGNHTMENGVCSVCGVGCQHNYNSVVTEPTCTEVGYTTNTCTICGVVEKTDYKGVTGHTGALTCTVCGQDAVPADFYTNILESLLNEQYTILLNSVMIEDGIYIVDSEVYISIDGGINGWGNVNIKAFGTIANFRAIIEDGIFYLCGENTVALTNSKDIYLKMPLSNIASIGDTSSGAEMILTLASNEEVLNWIEGTLLPFLKNLAANGKDDANLIGKAIVDLMADVEEVDGNIVITPSIEKIKALNERLATETVGEFIDDVFGVRTYDDIVAKIDAIFDLTIGDIIDGMAAGGSDVIELVNSIDALVATITGADYTLSDLLELETTIQEMIQSEELRAVTVEELVDMLIEMMGGSNESAPMPDDEPNFGTDVEIELKPIGGTNTGTTVIIGGNGTIIGDSTGIIVSPGTVVGGATDSSDVVIDNSGSDESTPSFREMLMQALAQLKDMTIYEAMGAEIEPEEIISAFNDSIDTVFGDVVISIKTDKNGTLISLDVAYGDYCDVSIIADYTSDIDYSGVKAQAEANTNLIINKNYLAGTYEDGEYVFEIDANGNLVSVWYTTQYKHLNNWTSGNDENGNYVQYMIVYSYYYEYEADLTKALTATHSDCGDWIGVSMLAPGTRKYESTVSIEKYVNGELVEVFDDPAEIEKLGFYFNGSNEINYNYSITTGFYINTKTGEIANFEDYDTLHNYEEDTSKHVPAVGCVGAGEKHYFCTECGDTVMVPYTNGHNYETTYELAEGATSCTDGVIVKHVCTGCGYVNHEYTTYYHTYIWEDIDLSGYGICAHHYFEKYSCPCGQSSGLNHNLDWYEDVYCCHDCGVTLVYDNNYAPGEGCTANVTTMILVTLNGTTIYSETRSYVTESHQVVTEATLMPGSTTCYDGVYITEKCSKCGKIIDERESYYHMTYEKVIAHFSEYGSTCGGYLYTYDCACGMYSDKHGVDIHEECKFETNEEYWNGWRDYLYKHTCAVTDPACGFTLYERARCNTTPCGYTVYKDYYIIKDGKEVMIYSYIMEEYVNHQYETLTETKTSVGLYCLYVVSRTEKCTECGHYNTYNGYDFIHEYSKHDDGHYCDICGDGTKFVHNSNGDLIDELRIHWYVNGNEVVKNVDEWGWIYEKGYQLDSLRYYSYTYYAMSDTAWYVRSEDWSRTTYVYDFSGECRVTRTFESSYKEYECDTYRGCCYFFMNTTVEPTCTQYGYGEQTCVICNTTSTCRLDPLCHEWEWYFYGDCYVCIHCGLKNNNGASGDIVLEDASDLDKDDDTYIIGYFIREKFDYVYAITLVNKYGDELEFIDLEKYGIEIKPWGDGTYVTFSKSAVIAAAKALGYTEDQYDIRISFVPVDWYTDLDYAITFEVMSATDKCARHLYNRDGACVFCGYTEIYEECQHEFDESNTCVHCGFCQSDEEVAECPHKYGKDGVCVICGEKK